MKRLPRRPSTETELLASAHGLAGQRLGEIAARFDIELPARAGGHKGIVGELMERVLGADAGSAPRPDFRDLGIELKTIPIGPRGRPTESTHVCTTAVDALVGQRWESSTVRTKLARVLWVPIEGDTSIALPRRRVGMARLWSPDRDEESVLRTDWEEHMELIATGRHDEIDARMGTWLQVRPKGANRRARVVGDDSDGSPAVILPRGFYLRAAFTTRIVLEPCS